MNDAPSTSGILTGRDSGPADLLGSTLSEARSGGVTGSASAARDAVRAGALAFLEASGFPSQKQEAWRFTPVRDVLRVPYSKGTVEPSADRLLDLPELGAALLVVNGSLVGEPLAPTGVEVERLSRALDRQPALLEYLGRIAKIEQGFVAQNGALFDDGLVVHARAGARGSLNFVHVSLPGETPTLSTPRVLVVAEPGSDLTLVEWRVAAPGQLHLESSVTEIVVADGARVEHVRVHDGAPHAASISTVAVRQERDSRYVSRLFTFGGSLTRLDVHVSLEGPGAECELDGLYLTHTGELVDHHTVIDHATPRCTSRERYKGVLDGSGAAVFDGTVFVRRGADGTAAHQENRNLLLSNDAVVHTKPHLEIDTDDVKCSHGATVGRLDQNQLFYLRSRGMDEKTARSVLTYAFAKEMAARLGDPVLRTLVEDAIARLLPNGNTVKELT